MSLIYTNILPVGILAGQQTIQECILENISKAEKIDIAVGYVSKASLIELERLVEEYNIQDITLTMGMYYFEGMPESTYRTAINLNEHWKNSGIGEIRLTRSFKYHGKVFCFYKNGIPFATVCGSANLGVMKLEASNLRQFEIANVTEDTNECEAFAALINRIKGNICSRCIDEFDDIRLIREVNTSLVNIEDVLQVPQTQVKLYEKYKSSISFELPLKVPAFDERFMDDGKHYTKSNLNVSYAAPRNARKSRDWYETQLTVAKEITRMEGYPEKNKPFFVITDDGYWFKVHTTSDGNKQFSAVGNELIMGRWIKGRLAAAGLVVPVNDTGRDVERTGMITKEMLKAYGCSHLVLTKTTQQAADDEGNVLDVWTFSFAGNEE